ncbi:MAG: SGNH/GDSL hydrolase family protein [Roseiflexaceae bacterium]
MHWYEEEVRGLERAHQATPPLPGGVLFYGSSSFRLWQNLPRDLLTWPVVNRAFGGSTLEACAYFFERLVVPCAPRSLICYAGDNDLGDGRSPYEVIGSFHKLTEKVNTLLGPIPFAFLSIKPSPARWHLRESILQVNSAIRQTLMQRHLGYYIDIYGPMLNRDGTPRRDLFAEDGLHLSPAGYRLWAQIISAYRYPLLDL